MLSIMLFIFFCFLGIATLCWHILRTQERHFLQLREEQARLAALLAAQHSSPFASHSPLPETPLVLPANNTAAPAPTETTAPAAPLQAAGCTIAIPETGPDRLSLDDAPSAAIYADSLPTAAPALELRFDTLPPLQGDSKAQA